MSPRELAVVLLRCWGTVSVLGGFFHSLGYLPVFWYETAPMSGKLLSLAPALGGILSGVALILLAGPLSTAIARVQR